MAASPSAIASSNKDGGNALAALLAAAAASMHRQQPNQNHAGISNAGNSYSSLNNSAQNGEPALSGIGNSFANNFNKIANFNKQKGIKSTAMQQELEAKRDQLCQLLNLKPASLIESQPTTANRSNSKTKPTNSTQGKRPTSSSPSSSSSSILTPADNDSTCATELLAKLVNGTNSKKSATVTDDSEFRDLESWHDEDEKINESCYQELVDPTNSDGWSADDMFKYNEKMHKVTSSYNDQTLSNNYTMPLSITHSKATLRLATQLAKEIEERVHAEGRVTPESSDDDELFENERRQRAQSKQKRHLNQIKVFQRQSQNQFSITNNVSATKTNQSSSQYSNSTETPATASLSSSPTLNDSLSKPVTSSSRNILRTCLT